ncbi:uclacyanin-3-like [Olea europaea var. sylvestris]|uniref:uclacyanin-3-like n=1 Tax=Olea europaea var. sylvestris TaxID=158386 RepID=UPI000C1D4BFF|nr:uclacyanin-3-like [Olea europaea var. sylvestris]
MTMLKTILTLAAIAILMKLAMAANYTVGNPDGRWDQSSDLGKWASSKTFFVGDNLIFQYTLNHDVLEVSKPDFDSCRANNPINSHSGGSTVITLSSQGKRYFICGTAGHCDQGMKLEIDIVTASAPPPATPSAPPPATSSVPPTGSSVKPSVSSPPRANNPINSHSGGSTVITLSSQGKRYFICGTAGHCDQGMKLEIDIVTASAPPPATPSAPPPATSSVPPTGSSVKPSVSSPPTKSSAPSPKHSHSPAPKMSRSSSPTSSPTLSPPPGVSLPAPPPSSATRVNVIAGSSLGLSFYIIMMLINL